MKDGDAALVESLVRLRREKFVPDRDVIVAFTADEEAGGDANGPAFLLGEHRDLIDAGLVVNLDGGGGNTKNGERQFFEVGTSEKTYVTFTLQTTSPGGHGSLPGPDNAIYRLAAGLGRLEAFKFPVTLTATTRASFDRLGRSREWIAGSGHARRRAVSARPRRGGAFEPKRPPQCAAAHHLRGDADFRRACRECPAAARQGDDPVPDAARGLRRPCAEPARCHRSPILPSSVTLDAPPIVSPESPPTPQIMKKIAQLAHSMWPDVPIIPTMATGFSDDRQTRNAGHGEL